MKRSIISGTIMIVFCAALHTSVSAEAADKEFPLHEKTITIQQGETLETPWKGNVEISNEDLLKADTDGDLTAVSAGEVEVVVRYRVKIEAKAEIPGKENQQAAAAETIPVKEIPPEETKSGGTESPKPQNPKSSVGIDIPSMPADTAYPVICLSNLQAMSTNAGIVEPVITVEDENVDPDSIQIHLQGDRQGVLTPAIHKETKKGRVTLRMNPLQEDDQYTLTATGQDTSGNHTKQEWHFTVNQKGTQFSYDETKSNTIYTKKFSPVIQWNNLDEVTVVSCMVSGKEVPFTLKDGQLVIDKEELVYGKNRITLVMRDAAGNLSTMEPWEFLLEEETDTEAKKEEAEREKQQNSPTGSVLLLLGSCIVFYGRSKKASGSNKREFVPEKQL